MQKTCLVPLAVLSLCLGCSGEHEADAAVAAQENATAVQDDEPCPDDGPRLPGSGICQGRASAYLNVVGGDAPALPDGCNWVVNETEWPDGYLLYNAAQCGDQTAKLAFAGGAQMAELSLEESAIGAEPGAVLVRVQSADADNPGANILATVRQDMGAAGIGSCAVRDADIDGWPEDALVVDVSPEEAAAADADGPRSACGEFGFNGDEYSFWRVVQGWGWFFQLGQDMYLDIDPRSLTIVTRDGDGWRMAD